MLIAVATSRIHISVIDQLRLLLQESPYVGDEPEADAQPPKTPEPEDNLEVPKPPDDAEVSEDEVGLLLELVL